MRNFLIKVLSVLLLCTPLTVPAYAFQDVSSSAWFNPYTDYLVTQGIVSNNTNFFPYKSLTRAELAKMAVTTANSLGISWTEVATTPFCDVPTSYWAASYINQLAQWQVINGQSSTSCSYQKDFFPNRSISRAETLKIIFQLFHLESQGTANFSDVPSNSWASAYINTATQLHFVSGYPDGLFRPNNTISRAEMSKVLVNIIQYYQSVETPTEHTSTPHPTAPPTTTTSTTPSPTPTPTPSASTTPTPSASSTTTVSLPSGSLNIYSLGDSLTEGDGDDSGQNGYPSRLERRIGSVRPGSHVHNIGVSGVNSSTLVATQLPQAVSAHPDVVTLLIGSNDMWEDSWNDYDTSAGTIANYTDNINTILSQLTAAHITVFVGLVDDQSLRPVASNGMDLNDAQRARMSRVAQGFNQAITAAASRYHAHVVDFYHTTIFTNPSTLADDGNHPNSAGYDAMTTVWFNEINRNL